ncbi:hypothetical protein [Bacillus aquiflavi]|uniref:hypothetical protein n=1 Tax=Bacillus aquiflavi TaxID=2672567 RepID=UPI001C5505DD|nr:hypothetical protein [Bacillus aquiflavi]
MIKLTAGKGDGVNENIVAIIGAALAKKYSNLGYHICLLGRTQARLEQTPKL